MSTDDLDQIARLFKLRESGALTDEEFQAEKVRVLSTDTSENSSSSFATFAAEREIENSQEGVEEGLETPEPRATANIPLIIGALLVAAAAAGGLAYFRKSVMDRESPYASATVEANAVASSSVAATAPVSLSDAFRAATGHSKAFQITDDEGAKTVSPLRLLQLPFALVLLTKTEMKDDCHACTGTIGVYYLKGSGTSVKSVGHWPDAVSGWGWGAAPDDWKLTDRYTAYPAIFAQGGTTNEGYTCGSATLTELTPEGPVQSDIINLSYSNDGAIDDDGGQTSGGEPRREDNGEIVNVLKGKSFDVRVHGTDEFTEHYVYTDGKFRRSPKKSRLLC